MRQRPHYDFRLAQGYQTATGATKSDIADNLRRAALDLVNARWDEQNRAGLIVEMQYAALDALDFLDLIKDGNED